MSTLTDRPTTDADPSDRLGSEADTAPPQGGAPVDLRGLGIAAAFFVVMTAIYTLVGTAIVEWWDSSRLGEMDADLNRWLEDGRSGTLDTVAEHISTSGDTAAKIALGLTLLPLMLAAFRRWHEWTIIVGAMLLEVSVFGLSSTLVGRDRPPVEQLDGAPTDSFPSGHIAAATALYVAVALVVHLRTDDRFARRFATALAVVMPIAMTWARLYQGMHYLTDAIAGMILGVLAAFTVRHIVVSTLHEADRRETPTA